MLFLFLYRSSIPIIGNNSYLGVFGENMTKASSGLAWYISAPSGLISWLLPIMSPSDMEINTPSQHIIRIIVYVVIMVIGSIIFAKFWTSTTNLEAGDVAKQIQDYNLIIPGFRKDIQSITKVFDKFIPTVITLSGAIIGLFAATSDLIGTVGSASGTGVLLTVGIFMQFYEAVGREQVMEMHPFIRDLYGK
jgi:preprotein translocase subunit SecY